MGLGYGLRLESLEPTEEPLEAADFTGVYFMHPGRIALLRSLRKGMRS